MPAPDWLANGVPYLKMQDELKSRPRPAGGMMPNDPGK
jgi:hypothetical protein